MVEAVKTGHPFSKLRHNLTLEVLINIAYCDALSFMFTVNKEARSFLVKKLTMIRNGFENEGLIIHQFNLCDSEELQCYRELEQVYQRTINRIRANRKLSIQVKI